MLNQLTRAEEILKANQSTDDLKDALAYVQQALAELRTAIAVSAKGQKAELARGYLDGTDDEKTYSLVCELTS